VGVEWIKLAQDRDRWRSVANAVTNLWVLRRTTELVNSNSNVNCMRLNKAQFLVINYFKNINFIKIESFM
jgi:hypothetical protein